MEYNSLGEYFQGGLQLDLLELAEQDVFDFVVKKTTLDYRSPGRMGDWLTIWAKTIK